MKNLIIKNVKTTVTSIKKADLLDYLHYIYESQRKSAWHNGVYEYAKSLLDVIDKYLILNYDSSSFVHDLRNQLMRGAESWLQFSYGGCSLIYNSSIAKRLCNKTELKRYKYGETHPKNAEWLEVQARALFQAFNMIVKTIELFINNSQILALNIKEC